ncbi:MAG TPA: ATP cone domain-containing protein, partial [Tepidisphaeraceae bacterium]|nr:ATP cone domain-containing protein [Tepidisphaeraceae bacterium]
KVLTGLERACYKRPVKLEQLQRIVEEVEEDVHRNYDKEVPSQVIGELVTERLRRLDQVAYVRFASVYRRFKTLDDLVQEAQAVIDARRFEDPSQGRLFIEPPQQPVPENGGEAQIDQAEIKPPRRGKVPHPPLK